MRMSSRERRMLIFTVLIGVVAVVQVGVIRPVLRDVRRLRTKARLSAMELQRIQSVLARRSAVERAYEAIRNRITSTLKPEQEIIEILLTIQKAAQDAQVEILENSHVKDEPQAYFNVHTVHFRGRGEVQNLLRMVYALQEPQLLLKMPQMELTIRNFKLEMSLDITRVVHKAEQND